MASNKASDFHIKVQALLDHGKLHEASRILSARLAELSQPNLEELLKRQQETYKYLLHYLTEGYEDSSRQNMLAEITSTLHFINDSILRNDVLKDSSDIYASTYRFEKLRKATLQSRLKEYKEAASLASLAKEAGAQSDVLKQEDEALMSFFSYVWTMFGSTTDDYRLLTDTIKDPELPFDYKTQAISALMLGNLAYFDRKGLNALIDIFESDLDQRLSARALVAIVLIIATHKNRITSDPALKARLTLWADSIVIYRQLREVIMSLIRAQDTQRISTKMQNEVIPELMKLRPELLKKLGKISEATDLEALEENPEWEEIMIKNGLGDKLKELTEMQVDGGDVMMLAFSNLKSFPFFNSVANWFLPFSTSNYNVASIMGAVGAPVSEFLDSEGIMCDSDKYSFVFSLAGMPESQRQMVNSQMEAQANQMKEMMAERKLKSTLPEFDRETTRFVRDIYRFFKLFRRKNDFPDPFSAPIDFISLPYIGEILKDEEMLNLIGEFYFKRGYYKEALPILLNLEKANPGDYQIWEKIGYCYNAIGELHKALEWYAKAELLNPDSQWLIKKIALCNRLLNNHKAAAEYYEKALVEDPDNFHLLVSAANSLLESGDLDKALAHFYHADYVRPDKISTRRGIAWVELLKGNIDKSLETYLNIVGQSDSTGTDLLNMGHAYFLKKDYKNALKCYLDSTRKENYNISELEKAIEEDMPVIKKAGGNTSDLLLLLEKVKFDS